MKKEKDGSGSPEVKSPSLIAPPPVVSSSVVVSPSAAAPESAAAGAAPPATPTAVKVQQVSRTIHRVAVVVGLVVALIGAGARSRLFGTGLGKYALSADECRSGKLMQRQGGTRLSVGGICTKDCSTNSDCGDGLRCYQGDCAPLASKALGQACEAPWDCQSDICAAIVPMLAGLGNANIRADDPPAQTICMQGCANGEACPAGEACPDMPGAGMLCAKHRDGEDSGADLLNLLQELRNRSGGGNTP